MAEVSKRHGRILEILTSEGTVGISVLADRLGVSDETVRRDLRPLAARGTVLRMHGAVALAGLTGEAPFQRRMGENAAAKQAIARAMAARIGNGESLALDTGTTTSYLARALIRHQRLEVVTNSTDIARTLAGRNGTRVMLTGGTMNGDSGALLGSGAVAALGGFRTDHAVISAGALGPSGVMDYDPEEAAFAAAALACGRKRAVISDATKFGRDALVRVCPLAGFGLLVSDAPPPPALAEALAAAGVEVAVAG